MKYLLSKGLIYKKTEDNLLTIWNNGKLVELNKNESIIWDTFSWKPKEITILEKKNVYCMDYSIEQLVKKGLLFVYEGNSEKECSFFTIASNKVKILNISTSDKIKSGNYKRIIKDIKFSSELTSYDKMVYNYLKDYNGEMSISDIVLAIDNKLFNIDIFTNGYTFDYIKLAYKSESSFSVINSILKLLDAKMIYIS